MNWTFGLTEILPLVEFFVEDDISAEDALQLIKTEPPKGSNDLKNGGEDYQVYQNDNQALTDPFASYFYSQQVRFYHRSRPLCSFVT